MKKLNEAELEIIQKTSGAWIIRDKLSGQEHHQYFSDPKQARAKKKELESEKLPKRLKEDGEIPTNNMGDSSSTSGPIATFDPLVTKIKKMLRRVTMATFTKKIENK
jgi:hypothetical protein